MVEVISFVDVDGLVGAPVEGLPVEYTEPVGCGLPAPVVACGCVPVAP